MRSQSMALFNARPTEANVPGRQSHPQADSPAAGRLHTLATERFCAGTAHEVLGVDLTRDAQWSAFQSIFESLEPDAHMADGGTYRLRRFGRMRYETASDQLVFLPHAPYSQPRYFNPLNGGIERHFAPLTPAIQANAVLIRTVRALAQAYGRLHATPAWNINLYFNRIVARPAERGLPVPEGPHRDGVRFSCLLMADRTGCTGGRTHLIDLLTHDVLLSHTLDTPGDCLVFRDDTLLHDTTAIEVMPGAAQGLRDVLVIEFDY